MSDLIQTVTDGFKSRFDVSPAGLWSAPGRVNLIGEQDRKSVV